MPTRRRLMVPDISYPIQYFRNRSRDREIKRSMDRERSSGEEGRSEKMAMSVGVERPQASKRLRKTAVLRFSSVSVLSSPSLTHTRLPRSHTHNHVAGACYAQGHSQEGLSRRPHDHHHLLSSDRYPSDRTGRCYALVRLACDSAVSRACASRSRCDRAEPEAAAGAATTTTACNSGWWQE